MEPSKKTQLLYKIFLRGYKAPNLTNSGNQVLRSNSYNFSKSRSEEAELRYKKRQRNPEAMSEDDILVPPPAGFDGGPGAGPTSLNDLELNNNPAVIVATNETEHHNGDGQQIVDDRNGGVDENGGVLGGVSWTCDTLDKRRDVITNYFQRAILKQRRDYYDVAGASAVIDEDKIYENIAMNIEKSMGDGSTLVEHQSSPEPIYAEIYSDKELQAGQVSATTVIADETVEKANEHMALIGCENNVEHLYENIDIIRHEILLRQEQEQQQQTQGEKQREIHTAVANSLSNSDSDSSSSPTEEGPVHQAGGEPN